MPAPLFASVLLLVWGRIPSSSVSDPEELPSSVSVLVSLVVSAAGASVGEGLGVGAEGFPLPKARVGACGCLWPVGFLCMGKKPVPLTGRKGAPVPVAVASAMLRVTVRVAVDTVVVRVRGEVVFFVEGAESSSSMQPASKYVTSLS